MQNDSTYNTPAGEPYNINKLKYYVSNVSFTKSNENVFLINAFAVDSLNINIEEGQYDQFSFLLGVDSINNCSGAQDGALDPLNDMFWTWNSGYVMFKLEGVSDSSHADQQRIEQHIGGYRGINKTMRRVNLKFSHTLNIRQNEKHLIVVELNLDKYWRSTNNISIRNNPVIVIPGPLAARSADNFPELFSIVKVE